MTIKPILTVSRGVAASDGAGVRMRRLLGTEQARMFDPFLMLDHFDSGNEADYMAGFPDHPHRGFETVTYMLEGRMKHEDSTGRAGVIGPGGVQWMRAGRGLVHSEMPEATPEGRMRGFQLWVNLPAELKMSEPGYAEFEADQMPVEDRGGGVIAKVVAGTSSRGTTGPVGEGAVQALYLDVTAPSGATFTETGLEGRSAMVVVYEGAVKTGGQTIDALATVFFDEGDKVQLEAIKDSRFLLIAGRPLKEPVAWGGPFVMNTREEVVQAFDDFRAGRFG